jgi:hypothetical protein
MKTELRILVEGNSSDGLSYRPVELVEWEADSCTPSGKNVQPPPNTFSSKENIIAYAKSLIAACERPPIVRFHTIKEVPHL